MRVLKSDLMAALNEEVKSLDEDNWKFKGLRFRVHLISTPVWFFNSLDTNCLFTFVTSCRLFRIPILMGGLSFGSFGSFSFFISIFSHSNFSPSLKAPTSSHTTFTYISFILQS